jgi:hypothetical protein
VAVSRCPYVELDVNEFMLLFFVVFWHELMHTLHAHVEHANIEILLDQVVRMVYNTREAVAMSQCPCTALDVNEFMSSFFDPFGHELMHTYITRT